MLTRRNIFAAAAGAAMAASFAESVQASRELKPSEWSIEPGKSKGGGSPHHTTQMGINQAYYLDARLRDFGVKILPLAPFTEGQKLGVLSPDGTQWEQRHVDAHDDFYLCPADIMALAKNIANYTSTVRFSSLRLPRPGPLYAPNDMGITGAGYMEYGQISLRVLTFLNYADLTESTRLDALFCCAGDGRVIGTKVRSTLPKDWEFKPEYDADDFRIRRESI